MTSTKRARLDTDRTAAQKTKIVGHFPAGKKNFYANAIDLEIRDEDECDACDGYGHIRQHGTGTVDRRERKCLNCNATGKRLTK